MKIYIAGPISGRDLDEARREFADMATTLHDLGHEPVNPFEVAPTTGGMTWRDYMAADLAALVYCDALILLPGWEDSRGARVERGAAYGLGMRVYHHWEVTAL